MSANIIYNVNTDIKIDFVQPATYYTKVNKISNKPNG